MLAPTNGPTAWTDAPFLELNLACVCTSLRRNKLLQVADCVLWAALHPDYIPSMRQGIRE